MVAILVQHQYLYLQILSYVACTSSYLLLIFSYADTKHTDSYMYVGVTRPCRKRVYYIT